MSVFPDFTEIDLLPSEMMTARIGCVSRPFTNAEQIELPALATGNSESINFAKEKKGTGSVQDLLNAGDTWIVG